MHRKTHVAAAAAALAVATLLQADSDAYTASGPRWPRIPVPYYVNGDNLDLAPAGAISAMQAGANTWQQQSGASFAFQYAGASSQTTTGYDGMNLVVFRNASSGSAIATTYWWSSNGTIIDADIVFWDGAFSFFAGTTGCASGFYIEDIAAHEFGHALGLGHSTVGGATMYPSTSSCNVANRSLDADDIAGVRSLYPPLTAVPVTPSGLRVIR